VFAVKPVILLVNSPAPVPSTVLVVSDIVGLAVVLQHTPLDVTVEPPSDVMFPPDVAVVVERFIGVKVVRIGVVPIMFVSLTKRIEYP